MKNETLLELGDIVYYVVGTDNPTIDKGRVIGFEYLEDKNTRVVVKFDYFRMAIRADLLGTDLFLNEDDAKAEQKRRREENSMPNLLKTGSDRI